MLIPNEFFLAPDAPSTPQAITLLDGFCQLKAGHGLSTYVLPATSTLSQDDGSPPTPTHATVLHHHPSLPYPPVPSTCPSCGLFEASCATSMSPPAIDEPNGSSCPTACHLHILCCRQAQQLIRDTPHYYIVPTRAQPHLHHPTWQ